MASTLQKVPYTLAQFLSSSLLNLDGCSYVFLRKESLLNHEMRNMREQLAEHKLQNLELRESLS